jgi:hypothetical protein
VGAHETNLHQVSQRGRAPAKISASVAAARYAAFEVALIQ